MDNRDLLANFVQRRQVVRDWESLGSESVMLAVDWYNMTVHYAIVNLPDFIPVATRLDSGRGRDLYELWLAAKIYYIAMRKGRSAAILWRLQHDAG